jgi:hypothetical protein
VETVFNILSVSRYRQTPTIQIIINSPRPIDNFKQNLKRFNKGERLVIYYPKMGSLIGDFRNKE